jgi:ectoine hydroxylase-related dioxygenase (phytanoyl-CoA dioxygenase family)
LLTLIGEKISFEEFSIMLRNPTDQVRDMKGWHRDLTRDYCRRKEIDAVSLVYYLTDVREGDHCFSIIPETHNRLVDLRPEEVASGMEFDVTGPAGTALIFHARCLHAGKLKPNSRQRRTLHLYYARSDQPRTSEWSDIPERLHKKVDLALPRGFYSKWNVTEVFEGTGKKPRDIDPSMSTADILREVQRRANQAASK